MLAFGIWTTLMLVIGAGATTALFRLEASAP